MSRNRVNDLPGVESRILDIPGLPPAGPWYIAYSGGPDSTVLLHCLSRICRERGVRLVALHADHRLNPASAEWRRHCERLCREWGIECRTGDLTIDDSGVGPEAGARRARYRWFLAAAGRDAWLFTAHHRDDQAETLIERLTRGAGPQGMRGMLAVTRLHGLNVVRPLLDIPRSTMLAYAERHALACIEDESNFNTDLTRNYIRSRVLPMLRGRWPSIDSSLARTAAAMADAQAVLDDVAAGDLQRMDPRTERGDPSLEIAPLEALAPARRRNALRAWIQRHTGVVLGLGRLSRVARALSQDPPRASGLQWPPVDLRTYRGRLYLVSPGADARAPAAWDLAGELRLGNGIVLRSGIATGRGLKKQSVQDGVTVRFRQGGDRCRLPGRQHRQALKKVLQDAGVPHWQRSRIPLITVNGEIAAITGVAYCDPFAVEGDETGVAVEAFYGENESRRVIAG